MSAAPRSTRREFLKGKAAADALVELTAGQTAFELPPATLGNYLIKLARPAMACQFEIYFNAGQYPDAAEAGLAALDLIDRLEDQLSIFRDHSEVSRLNRQAADEPMIVEEGLFRLLEQAAAIHTQTRGAFDITSGPLSRVWGFTRRAGAMPERAAIADALVHVGMRYIELDGSAQTVRFLMPGVEINLGAIGKGFALDRAAELFAQRGIGDFLLHGGNSSVLAGGANGGLEPHVGWSVGVRDPLHSDRRIGELRLKDRALGTSGSGTQFFMHEGRRYGHLIDPRSGQPAEGVFSVSVVAPTAAEADALATAFYVMGPHATRDYCAAYPQIGCVMLCPGEQEGRPSVHVFGLDQSDWTACEPS